MRTDNQALNDPETSRLILGTVQLGMDYGIANRTGQPDLAAAREIVQEAWLAGIREFDTAQGYGTSEEVLGRVLADLGLNGQARIITKLGHDLDRGSEGLIQSVEDSLTRLGVNRLAGVLLHKEEHLDLLDQGLDQALREIQERGLAERIGVSVYTPQRAVQALKMEQMEVVQIPANILDHRFRKAGVFRLAAAKKKVIYLRSVFLQGLILLGPEALPEKIGYAGPVLKDVGRLARELELNRRQLSLGYVKMAYPEARVLVGAETPDQIKENAALWRQQFPRAMVVRVEKTFGAVAEEVVNPLLWPR